MEKNQELEQKQKENIKEFVWNDILNFLAREIGISFSEVRKKGENNNDCSQSTDHELKKGE